ncbi:HD-GYP domain-containing protein [Aneurinibacillus terranovensis]|uniref:HD-GYP domain-containing protein n=1 Tax=Aneurinibacillus terranovensis TaxID=278991 RepID=UPI0004156CA5|nr:HD-GYP domain-containing protein [Aneurinibacillus terranovensis]
MKQIKKVKISEHIINEILAEDIYNEQGILLLGAGKVISATDIDTLLRYHIVEVSIGDSHPDFQNISADLLEEIDTVWSYDPSMADIYKETLSGIKTLFEETRGRKVPNVQEISHRFSPMIASLLENHYIFHPLQTLKGKDEYTFRHCINVGIFSALIGRLINLPDETCIELGEAGLFHDIGKMLVPDSILNKSTDLTREEMETMRKHTQYGYSMLRKLEAIPHSYAEVALYHHEKLDGSGYPFGLTDHNIPIFAQIVAVADKFDALCSNRPYRKEVSPFQAASVLDRLQYTGQMNPEFVTPFIAYVLESYVGAHISLSNGKEGTIVLHNAQEPLRPLIRAADGSFVDLQVERDIEIEELIS